MKRTIQRPWGRKHKGGWVILREELENACKAGHALEVGGIQVGARQLRQLIALQPHEDLLIRSNGKLEVETIERVLGKGKDGHRRTSFRKPTHNYSYFSIYHKAWLPEEIKVLVVLKPRKYGIR